jgi:hypothetical protein
MKIVTKMRMVMIMMIMMIMMVMTVKMRTRRGGRFKGRYRGDVTQRAVGEEGQRGEREERGERLGFYQETDCLFDPHMRWRRRGRKV